MDEFVISPELYKALGDELKKNLIQELRRTKAIASGDLLKSIQFTVEPTEDGAIVNLNGNDYITYIDKGRKPGKYAPLKPLEEWVKKKGLASDKKKVTAIAFAINNKIKKKGIKARPIIEKAYANGLPLYDKIINDVLDKDLNKFLQQKLNEL
jgi:hypothetical protein